MTPYTDPAGRQWHPYAVEFDSPDSAHGSPDGVFLVTLFAISDLHAQLQVDAMRETARVAGQVVGTS